MVKEPVEMLDLVKKDDLYVIYSGEKPMLTLKGKEFKHSDPRLLQLIITDIQFRGGRESDNITPCRLCEFLVDFLEEGIDIIADHFNEIASSDDLIVLKTGATAGPVHFREIPSHDFVNLEDPLFNTLFWGFSSMITNLNSFITENIHLIETDADEEHPFVLLLKQHYLQMSPEMRSAVHLLSFIHGSGIVLPVLFVTGRITASEYANGRLALHLRNNSGTQGSAFQSEFPYSFINLEGFNPGEIFRIFHWGAVQAAEYLALVRSAAVRQERLSEIIAGGESSELEFKSTFRWDLKAGKTNPAVERTSLKTITAFLNSAGGTLLIGIRDDGSVEGIESDKFPNEDKFLLHLWTLIRTSLGRDVSPYIQTLLEKKDERTVCIVKCSRSPKPVFLRQPGFNEEYYIRVGPSSNALDISEALRYISVHFRADQ
jgi:hypothetical protein